MPSPSVSRVAANLALLALLSGLAGCSTWNAWQASLQSSESFLGVVTPYRIDIVQGNVLTAEQVSRVRPGQTRAQVRDALGSPLLTDMFHADRWDYMFTIRRQGAEPQRRSVVVRFEGDVLKTIDAPPDLPTEREFVASISNIKPKANPPVLELTEEQRKALPVPPQVAPAASEPMGATRSYPPLEAR